MEFNPDMFVELYLGKKNKATKYAFDSRILRSVGNQKDVDNILPDP